MFDFLQRPAHACQVFSSTSRVSRECNLLSHPTVFNELEASLPGMLPHADAVFSCRPAAQTSRSVRVQHEDKAKQPSVEVTNSCFIPFEFKVAAEGVWQLMQAHTVPVVAPDSEDASPATTSDGPLHAEVAAQHCSSRSTLATSTWKASSCGTCISFRIRPHRIGSFSGATHIECYHSITPEIRGPVRDAARKVELLTSFTKKALTAHLDLNQFHLETLLLERSKCSRQAP
ncbi:hypothetical protein PINS_up012556 [Pythium insidiosum]|nr:hypothetical protein PINS_up012556 [Pythium insidiosum]